MGGKRNGYYFNNSIQISMGGVWGEREMVTTSITLFKFVFYKKKGNI